ncbi:uncharacterized protein TNCV_2311801 [Trichonephila clavipes]|nr:uncharacterized protein TNCV_2311801 [Trichonephila clavipes]
MTFCEVCGFKECHHISRLLSASSEPLDKLAIIADKVSEVVGASSNISHNCSSTIPVIFMQCSANHGLLNVVASATIIAVIKSRPANVFHLVHLCKKTSKLCHSWNGRALETYQPVIFLLDRKSGQKFLIDSGSEICVIPPSPTMNKSPSNFSLFAANNTKIPAYGMVHKELNLGLRRPFIWTFIIADVSSPIIGADFLKALQPFNRP